MLHLKQILRNFQTSRIITGSKTDLKSRNGPSPLVENLKINTPEVAVDYADVGGSIMDFKFVAVDRTDIQEGRAAKNTKPGIPVRLPCLGRKK